MWCDVEITTSVNSFSTTIHQWLMDNETYGHNMEKCHYLQIDYTYEALQVFFNVFMCHLVMSLFYYLYMVMCFYMCTTIKLPWIADKNISGTFTWWTQVIMLTNEHCAFLNKVNIKWKHPFQWQPNTEELIHRTNYTNYFDISSSDDSLQFLLAFQSDAYSLIL